ncbi:VirB4 family type IV secretion system protein [Enterococcus casseliflavus]|uniref:VirB4 family type IV secretion system protein n=1 Tax=Enterococcus casseliflavus TaxID=37734 RepID=UPI00132FDE99|nr:ATPase [Enterococcus casseliflavus]
MLNEKEIQTLVKEGFDLSFIEKIQPQGGITFPEDRMVAGDGTYACLHIYQLAKRPAPFWLTTIMNNQNSITKFDLAPIDKEVILSDIDKAMRELDSQAEENRTRTQRNEAVNEFRSLERYANEINQGDEVSKMVDIRIYVTADTQEELEKEVGDLRRSLKAMGYKSVSYIGKQAQEWLAFFQSYSEQQNEPGSKEGITVPSSAIGGGYPFNHQFLNDTGGGYIGKTDTGGSFIYNPYAITALRKSFSSMTLGKPGMGKSTLLKLLEEMLYGKRTIIRGFEKNRDWYKLIQSQNGKIYDLSGKEGMLNPMEPLATITDASGKVIDELNSYLQHRATFFNKVRFLNPAMRSVDILDFGKIMDDFYISYGLLPENYTQNQKDIHIIGLDPSRYPTVGEFKQFVDQFVESGYKDRVTDVKMVEMENFQTVITSMCEQYGSIFNGRSTFRNIDEEDVLFFDIETIGHFDDEVYKCMLYTAMNIVWNQALKNGRKQKIALENGDITPDEVRFFAFFLDECQEILSPDTVFVVKQVVKFLKEMRKFSAGAFFATQSPQELLPETSSDDYISKIKQVFELCNAKFFLQLDASVSETMKKAMGNLLTDGQYEDLALLEQGEVIVNLGGNNNYKIKTDPDQEQLKRFAGGH